jgi:hypothetical protein
MEGAQVMAKKFKHTSREAWLKAANVLISKQVFEPVGHKMPKEHRVTCGWPSVRALSAKNTRIGECWDKATSSDAHAEIIISMKLDDAMKVLGVLVHEDVHAIVGCACGHKGPFAKLARQVDLTGKLTATGEGPELVKKLKVIAKALGPYPHKKITAVRNHKKQTTRMIKCVCPDTGYIVRTTQRWIDEFGAPYGPEGSQMEVKK